MQDRINALLARIQQIQAQLEAALPLCRRIIESLREDPQSANQFEQLLRNAEAIGEQLNQLQQNLGGASEPQQLDSYENAIIAAELDTQRLISILEAEFYDE
ncbi:MAG: hypothetical protein SVX43_08830 [Cyanobacteriota bacterium]|nr:hypothetical protein [Cyanobacteriota bacterium]